MTAALAIPDAATHMLQVCLQAGGLVIIGMLALAALRGWLTRGNGW